MKTKIYPGPHKIVDSRPTAQEQTKPHYIMRVYKAERCRLDFGNQPLHRHLRGNEVHFTVCPRATVEIVEYVDPKLEESHE